METTIITFARAAEIMNLTRSRTLTPAQRAFSRLTALFGVACPDCGGSGSWGAVNYLGASHCYGCQGQGLKLTTDVTEEMAHEANARTEAGDLAGYFEQGTLSAKTGAPRPAKVGRMMVTLFAEIAAFAADHEPRRVLTTNAHATACVKLNDLRRSGRAAEIRKAGRVGTAGRAYEVWALS